MRWVLLVTAVLGALTIGCVDHRAAPVPMPRVGAPPPGATSTSAPATTPMLPRSLSTAPISTPGVLTQEELCRLPARGGQAGAVVTLSPSIPRGGDSVTITGEHLHPGDYRASLAVPGTDAVVFSELPVGSVGTNRALKAEFVMPSVGIGTCLQLSLAQPHVDPTAAAPPFLSVGNAVSPGPCEGLPDAPLGWGGHRAEISPPPYRVGEPITVSGGGLDKAILQIASGVGLRFSVYFAERSQAPLIAADATTWDREGNFSATFTPRADPRFSGLCIEVAVLPNVVTGYGDAYAAARFTYP